MKVRSAGFLNISKRNKMECRKKWNLCWEMQFPIWLSIFIQVFLVIFSDIY